MEHHPTGVSVVNISPQTAIAQEQILSTFGCRSQNPFVCLSSAEPDTRPRVAQPRKDARRVCPGSRACARSVGSMAHFRVVAFRSFVQTPWQEGFPPRLVLYAPYHPGSSAAEGLMRYRPPEIRASCQSPQGAHEGGPHLLHVSGNAICRRCQTVG